MQKGKKVVVFYVQEGKRVVYYIGNFLKWKRKGKRILLYRKSDRSYQEFDVRSPGCLWYGRVGEWLSG